MCHRAICPALKDDSTRAPMADIQSRNASGTLMGIFTDNPLILFKRKGPTGGKPRGPKARA
jgi:hypothetical protein